MLACTSRLNAIPDLQRSTVHALAVVHRGFEIALVGQRIAQQSVTVDQVPAHPIPHFAHGELLAISLGYGHRTAKHIDLPIDLQAHAEDHGQPVHLYQAGGIAGGVLVLPRVDHTEQAIRVGPLREGLQPEEHGAEQEQQAERADHPSNVAQVGLATTGSSSHQDVRESDTPPDSICTRQKSPP